MEDSVHQPVSYTHLDVYKRQPIGIMVQGSLLHAAALPAYDCVLPFLFPLVQELIGFID